MTGEDDQNGHDERDGGDGHEGRDEAVVFGDIHGNVAALEAVFDDMDAGPERGAVLSGRPRGLRYVPERGGRLCY
jgi:hypothetical protein